MGAARCAPSRLCQRPYPAGRLRAQRKLRVEIMAAARNITVSEASRPVLPRHAKLKFDETRKVWVILAPERVLAPDEIAVEVLQLCDGVRNVSDIVDVLVAKYAAPRDTILVDVIGMLQDLADKGFLTEAREKAS